MRQTAEDAIDLPFDEAPNVESLAAQIDPPGQAAVQLIDARSIVLPRRDHGDADPGVPQQNPDQFEGRVTGTTENGDLMHAYLTLTRAWDEAL
jgi:hypothetical protein